MVGFTRAVALLVPFVIITWVHWVRSMQQERQMRPRTSLVDRDTRLALLGARRRARMGRRQQSQVEPGSQASAAAAAAEPAAASRASGCPATRKPYHTILTATAQVYQQWQCRVMYHHWKKQRALDPEGECTELTGFTRLVASSGGRPDGLEKEIPSFFVSEDGNRDLGRFHGYRVINRPHSVVQLLQSAYWRESVREEFIYIAETDHILMQPLPNLASRGSPMAYIFNYMGPNPAHEGIILKAWPEGGHDGWKKVQSIGPSPVVIHRADLEAIATSWNEIAVALKTDPAADAALGWVIEMWGYAIASAKLGLRHQEFADFQIEPGALSTGSQLRGFPKRYWVFHYTYQFEYMLDGSSCQPWTIGEYSLDKRHFSDVYPTYPLPEPPAQANAAGFFLLRAFNEAMGNISSWPRQPASRSAHTPAVQTLYGRRRLDWFGRHANGFASELKKMPLIQRLARSKWACAKGSDAGETNSLTLDDKGDAQLGKGNMGRSARWGSMSDPTLGDACPVGRCIYIDGLAGGGPADARVSEAYDTLDVIEHASIAKGAPKVTWHCTKQ